MIARTPSTAWGIGFLHRTTPASLFAGAVIVAIAFFSHAAQVRAGEPAGSVLLYTDNTPGAIIYANGHVGAANRQNFDVQVVTSISALETALPAKSWKYVVVAEKHSEGAPSYTAELATYLEDGAWAMLYRWKEDTNDPPSANQPVQAPTALHVWTRGGTAWGYIRTKLDSDSASGTSTGYVTKSFHEVDVLPTSTADTVGMSALTAGLHAAAAYMAPPSGSCEDIFHESVKKIQVEHEVRNANCMLVYAPRPHDEPPFVGDPEKLGKCLSEAADIHRNDMAKIIHDYLMCIAIRSL